MKSETLCLDNSFMNTFWLTFVLLLLFSGIGEWVARLEIFQVYLTPPRFGVALPGHDDCFYIGNFGLGPLSVGITDHT